MIRVNFRKLIKRELHTSMTVLLAMLTVPLAGECGMQQGTAPSVRRMISRASPCRPEDELIRTKSVTERYMLYTYYLVRLLYSAA